MTYASFVSLSVCAAAGFTACADSQRASPEALVAYVVVEGSLACPSELPGRFDFGQQDVCMPAGKTPSDLPPEVCDRFSEPCGGSSTILEMDPESEAVPVGPPVMLPPSESTLGLGVCSGTSVQTTFEHIQAVTPEFDDVTLFVPDAIYGQELPAPDQSYYQAAITEDTILIAIRRCVGEVAAGACTDRQDWFFVTNASCLPTATGAYRTTLNGSCYEVQGDVPLEFHQLALADDERCDFDPMPLAVSGITTYQTVGAGTFCDQPVTIGTLDVEVVQDGTDLSKATATVRNSGYSCVDGIAFSASVTGSLVDGELELDQAGNETSLDLCAPPAKVHLQLGGFEPEFAGILDYLVLEGTGCDDASPVYAYQGGPHLLPPP